MGQGPGQAQGRAGDPGCEARSAGAGDGAHTADPLRRPTSPPMSRSRNLRPARHSTSRPSSNDGEAREPGTGAPRRRRSRGGRGRGTGSRPATTTSDESGEDTTERGSDKPRQPDSKPAAPPAPKPAQRQPKVAAPTDDGEPDQDTDNAADGQSSSTGPKKRRRRRGGRGRGGKKPTTVDVDGDDGLAGETPATQRDDATPDVDAARNGQRPAAPPARGPERRRARRARSRRSQRRSRSRWPRVARRGGIRSHADAHRAGRTPSSRTPIVPPRGSPTSSW